MKRVITVITVAILALGVGTALAQGFGGGHAGHHRMGPGGHGPGMECDRWMRMAERVDLSDAQRDQIASIVEAARPALEQHLEGMGEIRDQLRNADPVALEEAAVRQLAQEQAQHMEELIVLRHQLRTDVWSVLTDDQRSELEQLRAERRERHQRFRDCMRADDAS